jgi:hypothetical protein
MSLPKKHLSEIEYCLDEAMKQTLSSRKITGFGALATAIALLVNGAGCDLFAARCSC